MFLFILLPLFAIFCFLSFYFDWDTIFWGPLLMSILITAIFCAVAGGMSNYELKSVKQYELISIRTGDNINGSFVLGSGSVKDDIAYIFYTNNNGQYQPHRLSFDNLSNVSFIEKNDLKNKGYLFATYRILKNEGTFWNRFAEDNDYSYETHYTFVIPKGSVVQQFKVE